MELDLSELAALVRPCLGPVGKQQILVSRTLNKVVITGSGLAVIKHALAASSASPSSPSPSTPSTASSPTVDLLHPSMNPIIKVVTASLEALEQDVGDGSTSFVLMLAAALRETSDRGSQGYNGKRSAYSIMLARALGLIWSRWLGSVIIPHMLQLSYSAVPPPSPPPRLQSSASSPSHSKCNGGENADKTAGARKSEVQIVNSPSSPSSSSSARTMEEATRRSPPNAATETSTCARYKSDLDELMAPLKTVVVTALNGGGLAGDANEWLKELLVDWLRKSCHNGTEAGCNSEPSISSVGNSRNDDNIRGNDRAGEGRWTARASLLHQVRYINQHLPILLMQVPGGSLNQSQLVDSGILLRVNPLLHADRTADTLGKGGSAGNVGCGDSSSSSGARLSYLSNVLRFVVITCSTEPAGTLDSNDDVAGAGLQTSTLTSSSVTSSGTASHSDDNNSKSWMWGAGANHVTLIVSKAAEMEALLDHRLRHMKRIVHELQLRKIGAMVSTYALHEPLLQLLRLAGIAIIAPIEDDEATHLCNAYGIRPILSLMTSPPPYSSSLSSSSVSGSSFIEPGNIGLAEKAQKIVLGEGRDLGSTVAYIQGRQKGVCQLVLRGPTKGLLLECARALKRCLVVVQSWLSWEASWDDNTDCCGAVAGGGDEIGRDGDFGRGSGGERHASTHAGSCHSRRRQEMVCPVIGGGGSSELSLHFFFKSLADVCRQRSGELASSAHYGVMESSGSSNSRANASSDDDGGGNKDDKSCCNSDSPLYGRGREGHDAIAVAEGVGTEGARPINVNTEKECMISHSMAEMLLSNLISDWCDGELCDAAALETEADSHDLTRGMANRKEGSKSDIHEGNGASDMTPSTGRERTMARTVAATSSRNVRMLGEAFAVLAAAMKVVPVTLLQNLTATPIVTAVTSNTSGGARHVSNAPDGYSSRLYSGGGARYMPALWSILRDLHVNCSPAMSGVGLVVRPLMRFDGEGDNGGNVRGGARRHQHQQQRKQQHRQREQELAGTDDCVGDEDGEDDIYDDDDERYFIPPLARVQNSLDAGVMHPLVVKVRVLETLIQVLIQLLRLDGVAIKARRKIET